MKKISVIIKREYLQILRAKVFLISTVVGPLFALGILVLPAALSTFQPGEARRLAILDETGRLFDPVSRAISASGDSADATPGDDGDIGASGSLGSSQMRYRIEQIAVASGGGEDDVLHRLNERVRQQEIDAYLILPRDMLTGGRAIYYARNVSDPIALRYLEAGINRAVIEERVRAAGVDPESARGILDEVGLETFEIGDQGESRGGGGGRFFVAMGVGVFVLLTIMMYGQVILSAVVEDKASRLFEVLNSSASAFQLLAGKLVGVSLAALTQFGIWMLIALALLAAFGARAGSGGKYAALMAGFAPSFILYALLFFLSGFFLCATLYAALGASVSSEKEASQAAIYIGLLFSAGLYLAIPIVRSPDSAYSFWVSMIPILSPITMLVRIAIEPPPFWQIALALALNAAAAAGTLALAARVYREGMLSHGKRAGARQMISWARR